MTVLSGPIVSPGPLKDSLNRNGNFLALKNLKTIEKGQNNFPQNLKPIHFLVSQSVHAIKCDLVIKLILIL